jgi:hypothetical protein
MSDAMPEMPSISVHGGPIDGHEVKLSPGLTLIIGSGRLANLRLDHPEIELAHVKVIWDDNGISMIDNGSRRGTWVNGEPVETAALLDGDVIEFVARGSKSAPPKVKLHIPKGSVPEPPPPSPEETAARAAAVRAAGPKPRSARRRRKRIDMPDPRLVALGAGALALLLGGGWLTKRLFFTAPQLDAVAPAEAEPGQTITLTGRRFGGDAADNLIWFGDRSVPAATASRGALEVKVPPLPRGGSVRLFVETGAGRSRPLPIAVVMPLRAASVEPAGALPGDEVLLGGTGFADGVEVTVGGQPARVVAVDASGVRFEMPAVQGAPGSRHPVLARLGGRTTAPVQIYLGRVPLVVSFEPARGVAGDVVRIRGAGFAPAADGNAVTFDGAPALVVAASATEMAVVLPPPVRPQPETLAQVVVSAGGRTSSDGAAFPLLRLVEGTWVPRFVAGALSPGAKGQATVGTEIAPVVLLSGKGDSRSVGERALKVAAALNEAVDRARAGQAVSFEAREQPAVGVALVGAPDLLAQVTPEDAAGYETPPGLPARGAPPSPLALARHWAAVLGDTVVVGTSGGRPSASVGTAFAQLRAALPWQYGSGVSAARVVALPGELRRRLREEALRVP